MNAKALLIVIAALFAGTTVFYANKASHLRKQLQQSAAHTVAHAPAPPPNRDTARLRKLLDDRDAAYAELEAAYRQLRDGQTSTQHLVAAGPATPTLAKPNTNRTSWMDRMKQEDPERYKQIVAEREQRRQAMDQWFKDRVSALDERAQSAPTQEEADLATKIADNLTKLSDLRQQWQSVRDLPDDQREAAMAQLQADTRETYQNLRTLGQQDRQVQLQNLAQSVGMNSSSDVQKFVTTVGDIYQSTDYSGRGMGMGGGGGGHNRNNPPPTTPAPTTTTTTQKN
jgi:hypothetical protein